MAVIKAVDEHQDLLRISVASAGNDHRLGANEAPPAVVSMFLGDELTGILHALESGESYVQRIRPMMEIGTDVLLKFPKDTTDRNRTSPFAFTGNKFEFRMLGSTFSISGPNVVLNTIVADVLDGFATELEAADDFKAALSSLIKRTIREHKRIIFNGDNYTDEWLQEAGRRGLLNLKTTVDALPYFISDRNIALFTRQHVFTEGEMHSRYEILMENYAKVLHIEALTMLDMARKDILPAVTRYSRSLADTALAKQALSSEIDCSMERDMVARLSRLTGCLYRKIEALELAVLGAKNCQNVTDEACYYKDTVFAAMQELRAVADELEGIVGENDWPFPTYGALLFSV